MLRKQIEAKAKSTSGVNNINSKELQALVIPLCNSREQLQIVAEVERRLSIVAGAEAQVDANIRRADRLSQSILKKAFSGRLVPQDPNDEPGSVLLERIRAQQTASAKGAVPRQRTKSISKADSGAATPAHASMDSILDAILRLMQPGKGYSRAEIADVLSLSSSRWNTAIQELKHRGKVQQVGERRGARYMLIQ